jgi:DNA invertase Pin-like site-specific DNA recombinase
MKIGYARVSTEDQYLDLQLAALNARKCDLIFSDHGISGARFDRRGLEDALARAERGDTVVVWRLDRLGRSLSQLVGVVSDLSKRGVEFESLTENIDTKSPTGMLIFHMIAALAEFERALISERTRAGVAAARSRGKKVGRPPALSEAEREQARTLLQDYSEAVVAQTFNIHLRTLRRHLDRPSSRIGSNNGRDDFSGPHDQSCGSDTVPCKP